MHPHVGFCCFIDSSIFLSTNSFCASLGLVILLILPPAISLLGFGCPFTSVFKSLYSKSYLGFDILCFNSFNFFTFFVCF